MHFSRLVEEITGSTNELYDLKERLLSSGAEIVDLTSGNVNECGIAFPDRLLGQILGEAKELARIYRPDPFGQEKAREAIARSVYAGLPDRLAADHLLLTPGTSISYWYCFKLLMDEGDEVLCPTPSYPLFEYIANLCNVRLVTYRLNEERRWSLDYADLKSKIGPRTRAIVLISPHNPTGMVASAAEIDALCRIAVEHDLPVIADEVFSHFVFADGVLPRPAAWKTETKDASTGDRSLRPLVFTLNGLSKMFALPSLKIGWIAVTGPASLVRESLSALEMISDTFLPVNEIAQFSVPGIFEHGQEFLRKYQLSLKARRQAALEELGELVTIEPEGGFYLTLPLKTETNSCSSYELRAQTQSFTQSESDQRSESDQLIEQQIAMSLLEEERVLTHPGYFYDIAGRHLVITFCQAPDVLRSALASIRRRLTLEQSLS